MLTKVDQILVSLPATSVEVAAMLDHTLRPHIWERV
jgi:hypothetical protein